MLINASRDGCGIEQGEKSLKYKTSVLWPYNLEQEDWSGIDISLMIITTSITCPEFCWFSLLQAIPVPTLTFFLRFFARKNSTYGLVPDKVLVIRNLITKIVKEVGTLKNIINNEPLGQCSITLIQLFCTKFRCGNMKSYVRLKTLVDFTSKFKGSSLNSLISC